MIKVGSERIPTLFYALAKHKKRLYTIIRTVNVLMEVIMDYSQSIQR